MKSTSIEDLPQVLTAQNIADYLTLARNTVYELFKLPPDRGGIPNFNVGKSRRVVKSDFTSWIQSQRQQQDKVAQRRIEYIETGVRSIS
ncbi:helix-turn-helix domain-containing protein [Paenibacillus odorifer]|uniref:helix-turn-helix domain-containing protein n=1 Tax=Paenibacillus odorifer TaxID=189426 RepID=UPI00096F2591|nr:helix-turn-helix domain-containing protein [Paenibacillus odorifer]OMD92748.1 hypothetical protein BSK67_18470 [Paenibacillus odorifer]